MFSHTGKGMTILQTWQTKQGIPKCCKQAQNLDISGLIKLSCHIPEEVFFLPHLVSAEIVQVLHIGESLCVYLLYR